jgi:hypothetical protein
LTSILRQRVHVNVAIEGTTNSFFLNELGNIYGPEKVLVYQLSKKKFIRLSDLNSTPTQTLIKMGKDLLGNTPLFSQPDRENDLPRQQLFSRKELPPETAALHGIFSLSMFKGIVENPFISIILMDPLERLITLYQVWLENKGEVEWRVKVPFQKGLPFTEFAVWEGFLNYQSRCLGNRRLGDFDLVGVSECQEGFLAQLKNKDWTGFVNHKNQPLQLEKPRYQKLGITPDFFVQFKELNQLDYSIYELAKEFMGFCP